MGFAAFNGFRAFEAFKCSSALGESGLSARGTVLDTNTVRVTFTQCVDITSTSGIQVNVASGGWEEVAAVASGSEKVWTFTTTTAIAEGDTIQWQYLGGEDSIVDCVDAVDVGALGPKTLTNRLEFTAPTLVSAQIGTVLDGTDDVLVLTFTEAVAATDFADGWTAEEGANTLTVTAAAHPSATVVHLTIAERVYVDQTITVSYNDAVGSIADVSGFPTPNALASVTDEAVTNDVALVSLAITPDAPTIDAGNTQQFTATGTYNNGGTLDITADVTWDSSNDSFATIATDGLATGVAEGSVTITATLGAISDTTALAVEESAITLVSIAITPDAVTIVEGATQQFTATGTYSDASTADITATVTWDSSNDALATITAGGLATGVAYGQVTISATLGAVSDTTTLDVWSPAALYATEEGYWYDPSDFSTLWQVSDGTSQVTATGQTVARMTDKAGNGWYVTQATEANEPLITQDANNKYCLILDGISDFMTRGASPAGTEWTIIAGLKRDTDATTVGQVIGVRVSSVDRMGVSISSTVCAIGYTGTTPRSKSVANPSADPTVVSGQIVEEVSTVGYKDRVEMTGTTASAVPGLAGIWLGAINTTTSFLKGNIYGVIVRAGILSAQDLARAEAWMAIKTGVTL